MKKNLLLLFFGILFLISCDTTPASEQDDYKQEDEQISQEDEERSEEIAPGALDAINGGSSILAMANLQNPEDEEFSGKAYFTRKNDVFTLTLILNNADNGTYSVYLSKSADCEDFVIPSIEEAEEADEGELAGNVGSVEVLVDGTARTEISLRSYNEKNQDITNYYIVIAGEDGSLIGCAPVQEYIEENNQ